MKKKIIAIVISVIVLIGIGVGIFLYVNKTSEHEFSSSEQQWLEKNKVYAIDFYMPSDIAGLTYMGDGVFFDFINDMQERTGLDFNEIAYQASTSLEDKEFAIELVNKVEENQILMFTDHYVIITFNNNIYTNPSEINGLKLGVQTSQQEEISKYLTGSTVEYVPYETIDELSTNLQTNNGTLDGVIVLKSLFLDEILNYDLHIAYHIPELKMNYVLNYI